MIWESKYWKCDLIKDANLMLKWTKKRLSEHQCTSFEKKIFIAAYSIRKLLESEKIGSDFPMWTFGISKFLRIPSSKIDYMNSHRVHEHYNLEKRNKASIDIKTFCNSLIHSYIFSVIENESGDPVTFLFTSDNDKNDYIYEMEIKRFCNLLLWIGYSDVVALTQTRNSKEPSGFKIKRSYSFDDRIPREGLPSKVNITYLSECIISDQNQNS